MSCFKVTLIIMWFIFMQMTLCNQCCCADICLSHRVCVCVCDVCFSVLESPSRLDEEHRLIARYAARLAAEAGNSTVSMTQDEAACWK